MPMSISRIGALGASLVCSVESTRWPVSAASTAMCALSRSRISPTMITSGSARTIARSPVAKVRPVRSETWIWLTPARRYSTGSSIVVSVFSGERTSAMIAYSEVVLPEPVGPVARIAPWVLRSGAASALAVLGAHAEVVERERRAAGVEDPQHRRLAGDERHDGDADVDAAALDHEADAAVLGQPPLGDVELGEDLDARDHGGGLAARDPRGVDHHAVDAVADRRARPRRARSGCRRRRGRPRRR